MKYLTIWVSLVTIVAADSFFWWGGGKSRTLKQRVKNTYPLIDTGSVMLAAQGSPCPLPIACSIPLVIQVLGTTAVPHFLTQHSVSAAGGLPEPYANETSSEALTAEARVGEWRGAEGSSKVTGLVEGWISWPKKMHGASLQQCFAAVK